MAVFLIAVPSPNPDLALKISETFNAAKHVKVSDTLFMVKPDVDSIHAVRDQLGISSESENAPIGMVVRITSENATGVLPRAAVEWYLSAVSESGP